MTASHSPVSTTTDDGTLNAAHPEELRAAVSAAIGSGRFEAAARCTPAGLISVGLMVSCILLSVAAVIRAAKGHR